MGADDQHPQRLQWQRIFGALLEMLRQRQRHIETLAGDRKFLQEYVHLQHARWVSKTRLLESQVSQMRREEEMGKRVEEAKLGLLVALNQMEASSYKERADDAEHDLQDFYGCVETLSCEVSSLKEKLGGEKSEETNVGEQNDLAAVRNRKEDKGYSSDLRELKKWKQAYKKLSSTKEAEVSALLAEKDFVWHQFKNMESEYTCLLKSKRVELEQANDQLKKLQANVAELQLMIVNEDEQINKLKGDLCDIELQLQSHGQDGDAAVQEIKKLHLHMKKLQSSIQEKDNVISELESKLSNHDVHMRYTNRNSRLSKESNLLTKCKSHSATPTRRQQGMSTSQSGCLANCSAGQVTAGMGLKRCSKRKSAAPMSMLDRDSPRLFPSTFKIPKLKSLSPAV